MSSLFIQDFQHKKYYYFLTIMRQDIDLSKDVEGELYAHGRCVGEAD